MKDIIPEIRVTRIGDGNQSEGMYICRMNSINKTARMRNGSPAPEWLLMDENCEPIAPILRPLPELTAATITAG